MTTWIEFIWLLTSNEPLGSVNCGEVLDWLEDLSVCQEGLLLHGVGYISRITIFLVLLFSTNETKSVYTNTFLLQPSSYLDIPVSYIVIYFITYSTKCEYLILLTIIMRLFIFAHNKDRLSFV